ncbi:hypothetical protein BC828DRAFT_380543 [Blastocladiella britannica]|nr:hypothetical protein BC828DRAFT_380543 [Blastocladiella britannica]
MAARRPPPSRPARPSGIGDDLGAITSAFSSSPPSQQSPRSRSPRPRSPPPLSHYTTTTTTTTPSLSRQLPNAPPPRRPSRDASDQRPVPLVSPVPTSAPFAGAGSLSRRGLPGAEFVIHSQPPARSPSPSRFAAASPALRSTSPSRYAAGGSGGGYAGERRAPSPSRFAATPPVRSTSPSSHGSLPRRAPSPSRFAAPAGTSPSSYGSLPRNLSYASADDSGSMPRGRSIGGAAAAAAMPPLRARSPSPSRFAAMPPLRGGDSNSGAQSPMARAKSPVRVRALPGAAATRPAGSLSRGLGAARPLPSSPGDAASFSPSSPSSSIQAPPRTSRGSMGRGLGSIPEGSKDMMVSGMDDMSTLTRQLQYGDNGRSVDPKAGFGPPLSVPELWDRLCGGTGGGVRRGYRDFANDDSDESSSDHSNNPLLKPRNLQYLLAFAVVVALLSIAVPWTLEATSCSGSTAKLEACYITALQQCASTFPCANRGVPFLTVQGECACDCPAPFLVGAQCAAQADCPCVADPSGDPRTPCLPLTSAANGIIAAAASDSAALALGVDKLALAQATTLAQVSCADQAKVLMFAVDPRRLQLGGSRAARRVNWARAAVARHLQLSGNMNATTALSTQMAAILNAAPTTANGQQQSPAVDVLSADPDNLPDAIKKSPVQVVVDRIVYDVAALKVTYLPLASLDALPSGPAQRMQVETHLPANSAQRTAFVTVAAIALAMSRTRATYLALFWTQRLGLPLAQLDTFKARVAASPISVPMDMLFPDGGAPNPTAKLFGDIFASRPVFGAPYCLFMFDGDFQALNSVESGAFRVAAFPDRGTSVARCGERPTYGYLNLVGLRTGGVPTDSKQQALVLANSTRLRATFSATTLLPRAGGSNGDAPSAERIGIAGALDHVLVEYLSAAARVSDDAVRAVINGAPVPNPASVPAMPEAHVWGGVTTAAGNSPDVDALVAGISARVGSVQGQGRPDLFFGTSIGRTLRTWAKAMGKPVRWSRDAFANASVVDPGRTPEDQAAFEKVFSSVGSNGMTTVDQVWNALGPKVP